MDKCPTCKKPVQRQDNAFLPFCSERCKLIDLGKWVSEEYRVPGRSVPPDSQEEEAEQDSDSNGSEFNL